MNILILSITLTNISLAQDAFTLIQNYVGTYETASCSEGHAYTPITISAEKSGEAVSLEVSDSIFPKNIYSIETLPVTESGYTTEQDWGCWKHSALVYLSDNKLKLVSKSQFYNGCSFPSRKTKVVREESFVKKDTGLEYSRVVSDSDGSSRTKCLLIKK